MRIAILGATSMLAADFVSLCLELGSPYRFTLFARQPDGARQAMADRRIADAPECLPLNHFADGQWDAIVNFIGVGDPARAAAMGADILRITRDWDDRVLDYLDTHPACRYIFMSSGAAFGTAASSRVDWETRASFEINALKPSAHYGIAKFYSEVVHRSRSDRSIIDIRIFNYLSQFADLSHRFLINEIIAAVRDNRTMQVAPGEIWRDYLGREDFSRLMTACLEAPPGYNAAIDGYSLAPTSKTEILEMFERRFHLSFKMTGEALDATRIKSHYFSVNRAAEALDYVPEATSLETLGRVASNILGHSYI